MKFNAPQSIAKAVFETLEGRECMSASIGLQDGVLTVKADPNGASSVKVQLSADRQFITASVNETQQTFRFANMKSLVLVGSTQGDYIYVDQRIHLPAQITGDGGNDTIWGGGGVDSVIAGDGNDLIHAGGTIVTGNGNDTVWATGALDTIYAGGGNDLLLGGPGHDVIYGGSGHDTLLAGGGTDRIVAGAGDTLVYGSDGADTLVGGTGQDTIYGGAGDNSIVVRSTQTVVHAQPKNTVYKRMPKRPHHNPGSTGTGTTGSGTTTSNNSGGSATTTTTTIPPAPPPPATPPAPAPTIVPPVPPSPPPPPPSQSPSAPAAVITQLETSIIAGEGVNVNALSSTVHNGTALTTKYQWDFGDAGSPYNDLTGWNAGHVYDRAGTYTITLSMTDSAGLTSVATTQVTVSADNRPTIYVDTNGSDSNSGASPGQAVQTAMKAAQLGVNGNVRILFKRGETFDVNTVLTFTGSHVYVGAYGSGANPVLNRVAGYDNAILMFGKNSTGVTVQGLTFDSPNAVASGPAPEINANGIVAIGTDVVVRNNTFLNLEDAIDGELKPTGIIVQDNSAPLVKGLRGYFCWVDGTDWSILGNTVANTTRQHVIRANDTGITGLLIEDNNLTKQYSADDPAEIYKTTINVRAGNYVYISGNVLNDSTVSFNIGAGMTTQQDINWVVIEDNYFNNCRLELRVTTHDAIVRDNYFNVSGTADIDLQPGDLTDPYGHLTDITIQDNTGVNAGASGAFLQLEGQAAAGAIKLTGNLYVAPQDVLGTGLNGALLVQAPDLSSFSTISGNIWPDPMTATVAGQGTVGVVNYLGGGSTGPAGFLTPAQWDALAQVQDDQFTSPTLSAGVYQITLNGVTAGATGVALAA